MKKSELVFVIEKQSCNLNFDVTAKVIQTQNYKIIIFVWLKNQRINQIISELYFYKFDRIGLILKEPTSFTKITIVALLFGNTNFNEFQGHNHYLQLQIWKSKRNVDPKNGYEKLRKYHSMYLEKNI